MSEENNSNFDRLIYGATSGASGVACLIAAFHGHAGIAIATGVTSFCFAMAAITRDENSKPSDPSNGLS